jgi:hypothetical protein
VELIVNGAVPVVTVLVNVLAVALVPTYRDFAMAAPPAVVIDPPLLELVASVVLDIANPPDNLNAPVVDAVYTVVLPNITFPFAIFNAYAFVIVSFVPDIGDPAIYIVLAVVVVIPVFVAASVGC